MKQAWLIGDPALLNPLDLGLCISTASVDLIPESILPEPSPMQRRSLRFTDPWGDLHGNPPCQGPPRMKAAHFGDLRFRFHVSSYND